MCANVNPPTSSSLASASSVSARSLFSRLTAPLKKSRTRNLTDFYIRPLEPHRQYSPGDLVKGTVVLTVIKPIRLTHLTVRLHGFVRVYKHPNAANEPLPSGDLGLNASNGPRKTQYFGNGRASLFQDEITLCGEGRLDTGIYEFNFELEFPGRGLPTSIDTVDIGPLTPPKPRTISLEPISRRGKKKRSVINKDVGLSEGTEASSGNEATHMSTSPVPDGSASRRESLDNHSTPRSPAPSDIKSSVSADSAVSSSTRLSFRLGPTPSSTNSPRNSQGTSNKLTVLDKTITTTIELLKPGCLSGDSLPLKLSIEHNKAIKSLHGVIITFYRQGRIDSAPPVSLFTDIDGKDADRLKHDEYSPKSKTGLRGLSLTSAGSSSLFRKDLSQSFAPLIIDPTTLTAVVSASVRVPEDVFPTISGVLGEMISFKYYVEVLVDLGGKLAGQQRHLPRVGAVAVPLNYGSSLGNRTEGNSNTLAALGGSIVDTDYIRREKSVVACAFEVVVGSTDSARQRLKAHHAVKRQPDEWPEDTPLATSTRPGPIYEEEAFYDEGHGEGYQQDYYQHHYDQNNAEYYPEYHYNDSYDYQDYEQYNEQNPPPLHTMIPPPDIEVDENISEKERARRAEARLLPSEPPSDDAALASSSRTVIPPSVPSAPPEAEVEALHISEVEPLHSHPPDILSQTNDSQTAPSAPRLEDLHPDAIAYPTEDKQELQRRRLLAEVSTPFDPSTGDEHNAGEGSSSNQHEPSAPVLTEEEEYGGHYSHESLSARDENLPRYER